MVDERPTTLRDYLEILWRWRTIVAITVIVVPLVAVLMSLGKQSLYQASARVLMNPQNLGASLEDISDPAQFDRDRHLRTQVELARVPDVARMTIEAMGLKNWDPSDLLGISSVAMGDGNDILTFSVTSGDRELAAILATEYGRAFTRYRTALDTGALKAARTALQRRIATLRRAGETGSSYANLVERDQQLEIVQALQTDRAVLVRPAGGAGKVQPEPRRSAMFGFGLAIFLALGLVVLAEALDSRVRSTEAISRRLGLRLLARIPDPSPRHFRGDDKLVMLLDPNGPEAEAFRILRTSIELANVEDAAQTIMITSAIEKEGKSTTVANLAVALARAGRHVVLVDLDLRSASLHRFFHLPSSPGLTDVVLRATPLEEALQTVEISSPRTLGDWELRKSEGKLELLPAGVALANPGEFMDQLPVSPILEYLKGHSDIVLIDGPPLLRVGDAIALSAILDAVVVVARINVVSGHMLEDLNRILRYSPAPILGVAVTGVKLETGYGYFSYPRSRRRASI